MFHTSAVKTAKTDAHSRPGVERGKRATNPVTVMPRKARTGTDCRMSSTGTITWAARRERAAHVPKTKVKSTAGTSPANIRSTERAASNGSRAGSVETAGGFPGWKGRSAVAPTRATR